MLLEIFLGGLVVGSIAKMSNEVILGGGLLSTILAPASPILGVGIAGLSIGALVKETVIKVINNTKSTITNSSKNVEKKYKENVNNTFLCLCSSLGLLSVPVILIGMIPGLNSLLMPLSIVIIVLTGYLTLTNNGIYNGIKNALAILILGVIAYLCVTTISSGGTFMYFLSLITIPSLFFKKKIKESGEISTATQIGSSFLYGNIGGNNSLIGGILISAISVIQTILNGSAKDILGSILNNDTSVLLDSSRLGMFACIGIFLYIYHSFFLKKEIDFNFNNNNNNNNNMLNIVITIISLIIALLNFNIIAIVALLCVGVLLNIIGIENINGKAISVLLIVGLLCGF